MPTIKQKIAINKLSESLRSGKPTTMKKVLTDAGYAKSVANKPKLVTDRKGWKELLDIEFPNDEVLKVHKGLLAKQEMYRNIDGEYVSSGQPHSDVKGALDLVYKLKGSYATKEDAEDKTITIHFVDCKSKS